MVGALLAAPQLATATAPPSLDSRPPPRHRVPRALQNSHRRRSMPRTRPILLAAIFAMAFATSCDRAREKDGQAQHQQEIQQARAADEAAIRAASAAWSQASTAKDLDQAVSFYAA